MQFIRASVIVAVVVASTSLPTTTWADAAKYPVKGLLKSKSNDAIPAGVSTPLLLDTEAPVTSPGSGKVLVLQQVCCFAGGVTNIQVNSSPAGAVSDSVGAQNHCFNFNPGVVIPEGTDVTVYIATGGGCTGTGIVTTKK